jgi:hypothetical protein
MSKEAKDTQRGGKMRGMDLVCNWNARGFLFFTVNLLIVRQMM